MCDFQYLPVERNQTASTSTATRSDKDSYSEILSQLAPRFEDEREEYLSRKTHLFLPPLLFSRRQIPVPFQFEDDQPSRRTTDVIETGQSTCLSLLQQSHLSRCLSILLTYPSTTLSSFQVSVNPSDLSFYHSLIFPSVCQSS